VDRRRAIRNIARGGRTVATLALVLLVGSPAGGFSFADGRVELHGFFQTTVRTLSDGYRSDLWYHSQWFLQYVDGYTRNMPGSGPWNVLGTLTATTGYFQDRLLPAITFVYDVRSNSGAVLPSVAYRFTENFSATFGVAAFYGRQEYRTTAVTQIGASNRVHKHKDDDAVLRGLSAIRDRDEVFLRVKYTF
jgi:hypothetical protein